jgi:hypothetical protein
VTEREGEPSLPVEVLNLAADKAIEVGRSVVLKRYGLVVVPDLVALRVIAARKELPDTQHYHRPDGREVLLYRWPGLEPVDEIGRDPEGDE